MFLAARSLGCLVLGPLEEATTTLGSWMRMILGFDESVVGLESPGGNMKVAWAKGSFQQHRQAEVSAPAIPRLVLR